MLAFLLSVVMVSQCEGCPPGVTKVAVFEISTIGVDRDMVTTMSDLLRIELADCDEYHVVGKGTMMDTLGEDLAVKSMEEAIEYCKALGASLAVTGDVTKAANKTTISVSLINRWTEARIFSDELTVSTVEDLHVAIRMLATALCEQKRAKESATRETVSEEGARPRRRRESYHTCGFLLNYILPGGHSYGKKIEGTKWAQNFQMGDYVRYMSGVSLLYRMETSYWMREIAARICRRNLVSYAGIIWSGYRLLSPEDFSPFVGGGFGLVLGKRAAGIDTLYYTATTEGDTFWTSAARTERFGGPTLEAGCGLTSHVAWGFHFLINLKYHVVFEEGTPHGVILSFGISYKNRSGDSCIGF